ncbi:Hypothetical_protein [Hexamita inflata]|uniref:Hypothetical_protein n=1 Tax=Hexamita inflata TaxID=28002 RepID=A0AA86NVT3_9EUKA|nr:Hypothetical protein HINF_LOCUS14770 [Hexamita inflata]
MSFDDLENIYYGIQEELQKADNFMSHAIAGTRVTEACDNGLKVLSVVDKEIVAFTSKAKAFQGEDGKKAQEYVAELRQKHQTLKTQFMKIRDEKMGQNAVVGLSAGQEQLLQLDDMKNQALNGLAQATDTVMGGGIAFSCLLCEQLYIKIFCHFQCG